MKKSAYLYLAGAIVFELFGTTCLKASEGFTIPVFGIGVAVGYIVSLALMVYALRDLPLGLTYGIWGGVGTIAVAIIGLVGWGEPITPLMIGGIVLIVLGMILLNQGTEELEATREQQVK